MKTLRLELGARGYPIYVGAELLGRRQIIEPHIAGSQVLVVSNETVAPLYLERVEKALSSFQCRRLVLPDGEVHKNLDVLRQVFDQLLEDRFARDCTVVALGGGVVGDIAGFAAACYQRGVCYVQVPTSLLAQVDSAVGGKTAVNHAAGKNMIGAFHQPACVIADIDTLSTLPSRELRAGLAEVIKYGVLGDVAFFCWLEANLEAVLAREASALTEVVVRSCQIKSEIVSRDERESGVRALLNLGHTFGHAIESGLGYGTWLHGEAVAAGICIAADLSARHGWIAPESAARVQALFARARLPTRAPRRLDLESFLALMSVDKKVSGGRMRLVVLDDIGAARVTADFDATVLRETLEQCRTAA